MTEGGDYSSSRPDPACLVRDGMRFAVPLEGGAKKVDAARDDIDRLKRAVRAIATATGAALPPQ